MKYKKIFEDKGFVYELTVHPASERSELPVVYPAGEGYCCQWAITGKQNHLTRQIRVTDDDCDVIVYKTVEAAIKGAKEFLSI